MEDAGAACVELGVPFSDPIADGPTLQAAAARSLAAGTTLDSIEETVAAFRKTGGTMPILAFSYLNPLLSGGAVGGLDRRFASLSAAGFDGLLIPDLPVEEAPALSQLAENRGLCTTLFCAPTTTDDRLSRAAEATNGFLYVVGRTGVTGANTEISHTSSEYLRRVRELSGDTPLGVGFGIRSKEQVTALSEHAELAIVGSALVAAVHSAAAEAASTGADAIDAATASARDFLGSLRS